MKRFIGFAIILSLLFNGAAYARTYKIGMVPWAGFAPNNVADVKGFWKALGVDVKVITYLSNIELNTAFTNKAVDIADDMIGSWVGLYMEGVPITIIAELDWSHGGDKVVLKKDFDIKNIKGKQVGVYLNNPAVLFFFNQYLLANSIKLSEVKPIEVETEGLTDNFISGRFQAMINYDPQAFRAERNGNGITVATSAKYPGSIPEGFVLRTDVLKDIPKQDLIMILKGWNDAVKWAANKENWEEYKKILNTRTFETEKPYSDEDLRKMTEGVRIHDPQTLIERNKDGGGLFTYLNELKKMLKENNLLKKDFSSEEIFDNKIIMEVLQK